MGRSCSARTVLHCTALYRTVLFAEVKVGNHRIPSANYLAVIGMISVPSKTPIPILTPLKKSLDYSAY